MSLNCATVKLCCKVQRNQGRVKTRPFDGISAAILLQFLPASHETCEKKRRSDCTLPPNQQIARSHEKKPSLTISVKYYAK